MDRDRWQRITDLFDAAIERPAPERRRFLSSACADDPALLEELQSLLAAHERDPEFLENSGDLLLDAALAAADGRPPADSATSRRVGDWVLLSPIGNGRWGKVYLAERHDDPTRSGVVRLLDAFATAGALPPLPALPPLATVSVRPTTPSAPLTSTAWLDRGVTPDGLPYVVSPHAAGLPVDQYCARYQPALAQRVSLGIAACDAVQHAHGRLQLHGSLGPGDILVAEDGAVTIVDFGLESFARRICLANAPDGAPNGAPDGAGSAGLPRPAEWVSPEQLRGEPPTTACDVYALGVVLYGVLAGVPPLVFATRSAAEIERMVTQGAVPSPSEACPGRRHELAGALDAIVMTAMQRDPRRRYPTVHALGEDLRRAVTGRSVRAHRERRSQRLRRWGRRHPWAAGASVVAVLLPVALIAWSTGQAARANTLRRQSQADTELSRQRAQALTDLLAAAGPVGGAKDTLTVGALLRSAERQAEALAADPALQALRWRLLAEVYLARGDHARARGLLQKVLAYEEARYGATAPQSLRTHQALQALEATPSTTP